MVKSKDKPASIQPGRKTGSAADKMTGWRIYNVVGFVNDEVSTRPPRRAGSGVKGERSELIEDP